MAINENVYETSRFLRLFKGNLPCLDKIRSVSTDYPETTLYRQPLSVTLRNWTKSVPIVYSTLVTNEMPSPVFSCPIESRTFHSPPRTRKIPSLPREESTTGSPSCGMYSRKESFLHRGVDRRFSPGDCILGIRCGSSWYDRVLPCSSLDRSRVDTAVHLYKDHSTLLFESTGDIDRFESRCSYVGTFEPRQGDGITSTGTGDKIPKRWSVSGGSVRSDDARLDSFHLSRRDGHRVQVGLDFVGEVVDARPSGRDFGRIGMHDARPLVECSVSSSEIWTEVARTVDLQREGPRVLCTFQVTVHVNVPSDSTVIFMHEVFGLGLGRPVVFWVSTNTSVHCPTYHSYTFGRALGTDEGWAACVRPASRCRLLL